MKVVHPIDVLCQGRKATIGEVISCVNTLILTLTADRHNAGNAEALYEAVRIVAIQEDRLDLPKFPRSKRAVRSRCTDATAVQVNEERIKAFYTDLYLSVMETGAKALLSRYSKNNLNLVELLRRSLEDNSMT